MYYTPAHNGTFGIYLNSIRNTKQLTEEQVDNLIEIYHSTGDIEARNQVVENHLLYVISVAKTFQTNGFDIQDLIQEGNIGLIEATEHYTPKCGTPYIIYATFWIRKYISSFVSRYRSLIVHPLRNKRTVRVESLDAPLTEKDDLCLADTCAVESDNNCEKMENDDYNVYLSRMIAEAFETLSVKEEQILRYTYGIDCHPEFDETIAEMFGVSIVRIRQLRNSALHKLNSRINL